MSVHSVTYLFLFYLAPSFIRCHNSVSPLKGPPFYQCFPELCWVDHEGSGNMSGDALSGHIAPDANISLWDAYSTRPGDIVLNDHIESRLDSAVLGTTILRYSDRYVRYITDKEGVDIGTLNIERPVPDPGTLFSDLAQDSLLAGVPTGLRSEVDPESLVPSPTEACGSRITKCSVIVPVRMKNCCMTPPKFSHTLSPQTSSTSAQIQQIRPVLPP